MWKRSFSIKSKQEVDMAFGKLKNTTGRVNDLFFLAEKVAIQSGRNYRCMSGVELKIPCTMEIKTSNNK
jgi:hypothetical protein